MADTPQMGGFVAVKTAGGVQMLPPSEAADLILAGEAEQASAEDIRRNYMRDDPGLAAMLGAARGATVGLSDIALSSAGLGHEAQQEYAQENPVASTLGEIGGIAGSMLLPGGGLVGQTARVGGAVGKAMLPRLPRIGKLVQSAGEGAALSGAMGAAEAVIDPEKTAADVLEQAAWGGTIGAGIGAASLGIGRLAKFARKEVAAEATVPDAQKALEQARQRSELSKLRAENEAILKDALGEEAPLELLSSAEVAGVRVKVSEAEFRLAEKKALVKELEAAAYGKPPPPKPPAPAAEPYVEPDPKALLEIGRLKQQIKADREALSNLGDDLFGPAADPSRALSPAAYAAKREADAALEDSIKAAASSITQIERDVVRMLKAPRGDKAKIAEGMADVEKAIGEIKDFWADNNKVRQALRKKQRGKLTDEQAKSFAQKQSESGVRFDELVEEQASKKGAYRRWREFERKQKLRGDPDKLAARMREYEEAVIEEATLKAQRAGLTRDISADLKSRIASEDAKRIAALSPEQRAGLEQRYIGTSQRIAAQSEQVKALEGQFKKPAAPKATPEPDPPRFTPEQARQQLPQALAELDALKINLKDLSGKLTANEAVRQRLAEMAKRGSPDDALNRWAANEVRIRELDSILGPAAAEKASALSAAMSKMGGSVLARIIAGSIGHAIGGPVGAAAGWVVAPKIASRVLDAVGGRAAPVVAGATRLGDMANKAGQFVGKVGRPLKPAAITMTAREFAELRDELQATEPGQMEAEALAAMPSNMDPGIGAKVVAQSVGRVEYLRSIMPQQQQTLGNYLQPTQEQLDSFARSIRAVIDPNSVHDDFAQGLEGKGGGVSKEAIAAAELLDGDTLARLRAVTEATLWRRKTNTLHQQQLIARYLGKPNLVEPVFAPHTALAMANIQGEQKPPPKAPGRPSKLGDRSMTDLERISTGEKA